MQRISHSPVVAQAGGEVNPLMARRPQERDEPIDRRFLRLATPSGALGSGTTEVWPSGLRQRS
ncbi:hypothetical protein IL54_1584 [Sphingobium sp. ba1]|nr:hypothetical protein IL54_1584 [Sphingobium sp. ba1]